MASIAEIKRCVNLRNYGKNEAVWDIHKSSADTVSNLYRAFGTSEQDEKKSNRIKQCAGYISFAWFQVGNEKKFHLVEAHFCRARSCPICAWRRSLMLKARFANNIINILYDYPKARFIFLTLTVENVPVSELRDTLKDMNRAFKRMYESKRMENDVLGFIRNVEVTRDTKRPDYCHPHFHIIIMVKSTYYSISGHYINQKEFTEMWKKALRVSYNPIVHVKTIKKQTDINQTVKELFKYCIKEQDILNDVWYIDVMRQLHHTRAISTSGVLKDVVKEIQDTTDSEMIHLNDSSIAERISENLNYKWNRPIKKYRLDK